ncbi:hypothetical protein GGI12_003848 [Dipsacomyces acuminosporus]|nr:hypothetical protein GGI12_003848 [Dipsacomyces acuminosporus]
MPILYASSSIRQAILYEPEEVMGRSPHEYVASSQDALELKKHHSAVTDDNVLTTTVIVKSKSSMPVLVHAIVFTCGNVNFARLSTYPNVPTDQQSRELVVQRYKCILSEGQPSISSEERGGRGAATATAATAAGAGSSSRSSLNINATYSMRTSYQACFVLDMVRPDDPDSEAGPKISFATDSINRILDVDSSDLQDVPFLSLVTMEDNEKAYRFLEKAMRSTDLVLERLCLLVNPLEESHLISARSAVVEFMAMGSDDGILMLCQLEKPKSRGARGNSGYMSLEDIISSDPATSDLPDEWKRMDTG